MRVSFFSPPDQYTSIRSENETFACNMKATKSRSSATSASTVEKERKPFISAYYIFFKEEKAKMAKTNKDMPPRERLKYIVSKWRKLDLPTRCIYEQEARDQVSHRKNLNSADTSSMDTSSNAGKQRAARKHPRQRQYLPVQQQKAENDHNACVSSNNRHADSMPCQNPSYQWEYPWNMQQQSLFAARHTIPKVNTSPRHTTPSRSNLLELSNFPTFCSSSSMSDCYESDNNTQRTNFDLSCWSFDESCDNSNEGDDKEAEEDSFSQLELSKSSNYKMNLQERINRALAVTNSFRDDDFVNFVADLFGKCTN